MTFRARLLLSSAVLFATSAWPYAQARLTLTAPTAESPVLAGQPITVTWTGGDPSTNIAVLLIDLEARAEYLSFGAAANTGARIVTIPVRYGPGGTCGRTFLFYIEDSPRTMWTYGTVFTVICTDPDAHVESVLVGKSVYYLQRSDAPPSPASDVPFGFDAEVAGSDLAGIRAPSISVPAGAGILHPFLSTVYNGGVLGYNGDPDDEEWRFGAPNFNGFGAPTAATIDKLFPSGVYTFSVLGAKIPLRLSPPVALGAPPAFTLTGGTWMDGKYVVNVRNPVTITSTPFLGYGANAEGVIDFSIGGVPGSHLSFHSQDPGADTISFTIDACQLLGGEDYRAFGAFWAVVDYSTDVPGLPSSFNAAYHRLETEFVISAVGTCNDTTPPVIEDLTTSAPTLWPPDHRMVAITANAVATDDVSSTVTTRIVSVTSNEPDNGLGDGDTPGDIEQTGPMSVNLRAERSGKGSGRVYTITVEAADEAGNTTTRDVQVVVPHSQRRSRF